MGLFGDSVEFCVSARSLSLPVLRLSDITWIIHPQQIRRLLGDATSRLSSVVYMITALLSSTPVRHSGCSVPNSFRKPQSKVDLSRSVNVLRVVSQMKIF